jgi:septum formation inhibitor-activating ATPase MinD
VGEPISLDPRACRTGYRNIARRIGGEEIEFLSDIKKESALKRLVRALNGEAHV